jgi:tetratricopeptide (TPR) repeat protein
MDLVTRLSSLFGKNSDYPTEYKRFKKAMSRNPGDQGLKAQFIKFSLLNRFTNREAVEGHMGEILRMFDRISQEEPFDLQCHYLVGKYHQEMGDYRQAYQVYLNALRRFNRYVGKNPDLKSDNVELAYSVALNLMTLQSNPVDPEVERCFKIIRKSFPLHLKRIELENEMAKPAPDRARIKALTEEVRRFKTEEDKNLPEAAPESREAPAKKVPPTAEEPAARPPVHAPKALFSKIFSDLAPEAVGLSGAKAGNPREGKTQPPEGEKMDFLKLPPPSDFSDQGFGFMAYLQDRWEGPFTPSQLHSKGFLRPVTWVCRVGSQQVLQAYEVPDLHRFF